MPLTRVLFTALSVLVLTGCSASKLDLREEIDLYRSSFHEKLAAKEILVQQFLAGRYRQETGRTRRLLLFSGD